MKICKARSSSHPKKDLPYDVKGDKIVLDDVDFGVWYVDAYDHPELYLHKEIDFKGQIFRPKRNAGQYVRSGQRDHDMLRGRCTLLRISMQSRKEDHLKAKSWMQIRARFAEHEAVSSFGNKQPVLYLIDMEPAAEPKIRPGI